MKRTRYLLALGFVCALPFGLIACGDDDKKAAATATTEAAEAPEDVIAPDSEVATGLAGLKDKAVEVSKETDVAAAKKTAEELEDFWAPVEGTVKKNEPDMYSTIEEDLSLLESGEPAKTKSGADEMGETVDAYLAKYPG
jgi:hypothetical protein